MVVTSREREQVQLLHYHWPSLAKHQTSTTHIQTTGYYLQQRTNTNEFEQFK